jgi:hypothetical protein
MAQAFSGFLAAVIGWLTLEFLSRPLRKFWAPAYRSTFSKIEGRCIRAARNEYFFAS